MTNEKNTKHDEILAKLNEPKELVDALQKRASLETIRDADGRNVIQMELSSARKLMAELLREVKVGRSTRRLHPGHLSWHVRLYLEF